MRFVGSHRANAGTRVLVGGIERGQLIVVRAFCEIAGCQCEEVDSLEHVFARLKGWTPDAVIVSRSLLGAEAAEAVSKIGQASRAPILLISQRFADAAEQHADRVVLLRAGAQDYITMPTTPEEVLARVGAIVRRRHAEIHPRWRPPEG